MSTWRDIQKELIDKHELIAEINVKAITPIRIGNYKGTPYGPDINSELRQFAAAISKSLRGSWRWWSRVAIVGAHDGKIDYKEGNECLNEILGGTDEGVSLFRVVAELPAQKSTTISRELLQIPRIKLLLLGTPQERRGQRESEEVAVSALTGLECKILLYGCKENKKVKENVNFALSSLLLSLILGGVGSITRRAFGSLKIISVSLSGDMEIDKELQDICDKFDKEKVAENLGTADRLKSTLESLCRIAIKYAPRCKKVIKGGQDIPEVPSLSNIRIEVIEKSLDLVEIGNAFLKQSLKRKFNLEGKDLHTWILGLPRYQRGTGYAADGRGYELRRISAIGVRLFEVGNKKFVVLYGLPSKDWPEDLQHLSYFKWGKRKVPLRSLLRKSSIKECVEAAFDDIFNKVKALLTR